MAINKLKWILMGSAVVFLVVVEWVRHSLTPHFTSLAGHLLIDGVIVAGILFFFGAVFEVLSQLQDRLERQNREIEALHAAAMDICSELSLEVVLQKVVDTACQLLDARYGAISIVDEDHRIQEFITSGLSPQARAEIGPPPEGKGLLGVALWQGRHLRLTDLTQDPRSVGFPEKHPPMQSLLAVPILCKGPFRGNLYLSGKKTAAEFTPEDEETLVRFATKITIAIDNAHMHQRMRAFAVAEERLRIAREMHDGLAQVLAYVNTKAQAVKEYLRQDRSEEASEQLEQLAAAAREVYTDAREGISALRTRVGEDRSLAEALEEFVARWQDQCGIVGEVVTEGNLELTSTAELQLLRIIQESLTNVRKHSGARNARVVLRRMDQLVHVEVEDDGHGFDPKIRRRGRPRFGLAIMRERAESIGARLEVRSVPSEGTLLTVQVPVRREFQMKEAEA